MKGEKVDLNSIKNSVVEEMKGVKERVSKLGIEAGNIAKEKGGANGPGNAICSKTNQWCFRKYNSYYF